MAIDYGAIVRSFMGKNTDGAGAAAGSAEGMKNAGSVTDAGPSIPKGQEFDQPAKTFGQQIKEVGVRLGKALAGGGSGGSSAAGQSLGTTAPGDPYPGAAGGEAMFDPTRRRTVDFGKFANMDNLVFRQTGGPVRAGQPAVVGEAGPEVIVPERNVNVIAPPKGPAAQDTGESSIIDTLLGGLKTGLIMATAEGRERHFEAQQRSTAQLLQAVEQFPELADVPEVQKRMNRFFGDRGETLGFIAAAAASKRGQTLEQQAETLLPMMGIDRPGIESQVARSFVGPTTPSSQEPQQFAQAVTPPATTLLREGAERAGLGFSISPKTGITIRGAAPNKRDRDEAQVMAAFEGVREAMGDDIQAAQVAMSMGNRNRLLVPEAIRKLAFAKTENEIAAARAGMEEFERATQGNRAEVQAAKEAEAAASARGRVIGEAAGNVDNLRNTVTINFPGLTPGAAPQPVQIPVGHLKGMTDPITDSAKLRGFMLPDGSLPPAGISPAQLMAAGAIPIDTQSEQLARRVSGIGDIVGDMKKVAKRLFPTDDVQKRTRNAAQYYYDWAIGGKIPEVTLISSLNARIGQLVAAMGGETANRLSDADVKRMADGFGFGFFESKTTSGTKIGVIMRGLEKLREGLLSGRLVGEITANGGNPAEVARLLGVDKEFETAQKTRAQGAPTSTGGTVQPPTAPAGAPAGAPAPAAAGQGQASNVDASGKPLRGRAASEFVGGTLMSLGQELAAEVEAGNLTMEQAEARLRAAEKAGLPPGEGLPGRGETTAVSGATQKPQLVPGAQGGRTVDVGGVQVHITP